MRKQEEWLVCCCTSCKRRRARIHFLAVRLQSVCLWRTHCTFSSLSALHLSAFKNLYMIEKKSVFMALGGKKSLCFLFYSLTRPHKNSQVTPPWAISKLLPACISVLLLVHTDQWSSGFPHFFASLYLYCTRIYTWLPQTITFQV